MGPRVSHAYTQIFLRVVSMKGNFSLILGNSSNEVPLCIFHQPQTFINKMIIFFSQTARFHSQFDHPDKSLQMGKHNRIKVQAQYCSELIWSPLAELGNKSRMSENVIELNKPNIFREIDCLHNPPGNQSHPCIHKATFFHGQSPCSVSFLMDFNFYTLSLLVTQESFLLTLISARIQILAGLISVFSDRGLFLGYPGLKKKYTS